MPRRLILSDLKMGLKLDGNHQDYNRVPWLRVEFVAHDWAVARDPDGKPIFLEPGDYLVEYEGS